MTVEITWHKNTEGEIRLKWCRRRAEAGVLFVDEKHQTTTTTTIDDEIRFSLTNDGAENNEHHRVGHLDRFDRRDSHVEM